MAKTIKITDYKTQRDIKFSVESNASKIDDVTKFLESGGVLNNPDYGLEAIKAGINDAKKSVSDGKAKVAAAIAAKGISTAADSTFDTLAANIGKIVTLGSGSADANATAAQILSGYSAYVKGVKVNGSIKSLGAQTITPGTAAKTIAANQYLSGVQTIAGDANLVAGNIAKGKSIFGVAGTYEGNSNIQCKSDLVPLTYPTHTTVKATTTSVTLPFTPSVVFAIIKMVWPNSTNADIYSIYFGKPSATRYVGGSSAIVTVSSDLYISFFDNTTFSISGSISANYMQYGPAVDPTNSFCRWYALQ